MTTLSPTAQHGTVVCTAAGACIYTPAPNYHGPDSFTYAISDGHGGTDTATVSITVMPVNDDPNALDDSLTTPHGHRGLGQRARQRLGRRRRHAHDLRLLARRRTALSACVATSGVCTYTPDPGYSGPDTFDYFIIDGHGGGRQAVVSVTVTPATANQPPVADDEALDGRRGHARERQRPRRATPIPTGTRSPSRRPIRPPRTARVSCTSGRRLHLHARTPTTTGPTRSSTRSPTATAARTPGRSRSRSRR